jgi:uncharacterized membrane protein
MTDFFAAYLFLIGAVILLIIGIWSKITWVLVIAATSWFMAGLYCILTADGALWVDALGIFCVFAGIGTLAARSSLWKKEVKESTIKSRAEHINDRMAQIRKARNSGIDKGY